MDESPEVQLLRAIFGDRIVEPTPTDVEATRRFLDGTE